MLNSAVRRDSWLKAGMLISATLALYYPVINRLVHQWWRDADYSHGFLIPPLVGYLIWERRQRLGAVKKEPSNWGLLLLLGAAVLLFLGSLGAELFLTRISLMLTLAALVIFFLGWPTLRLLMFPLAVMLLMIPIPQIIFNQITFPLQLLASRLATLSLSAVGVPVLREGNLVVLPNDVVLEVAEACSGIRSLISLVTLGVAYGYFMEKRNWVRWVLIASTVPIAVASNALRVTGTGVLTYFFGEQAAEGFFHYFSGWAIFLCAFLLLVAVHKLVTLGLRVTVLRTATE